MRLVTGSGLTVCQENSFLPASSEDNTRNLAQQLRLHSPFRALDINQKAREDVPIDRAKRKRSPSSSPDRSLRLRTGRRSSVKVNECKHQHLKCPRPAEHAAGSNEVIPRSSSDIRRPCVGAPQSLKASANPYQRKSRHKTRDDHYTLKQVPQARKHRLDEDTPAAGKRGKRKRKEKSGSALMHEFHARNVARDRLTVSSAHDWIPRYCIYWLSC